MTLKTATISVVALMGIHAIALIFNLYHQFLWLDIPMHLGGGLVVMLVALAFWSSCVDSITFKRYARFSYLIEAVILLGFVALIGIGWEGYEFILDQLVGGSRQPSIADTMADFSFDLAGGIIGFILFRRV
jgi:hypothetical protein